MIYINSINVSPKNLTLKEEDWFYGAYVTVSPASATKKSVSWHSSNSMVASVNETTGYIYAMSPGTTRVYVNAIDGSGCYDYINVTVERKEVPVQPEIVYVESITVYPSTLDVRPGQAKILFESVRPENATNKNVLWSSSNEEVAVVNPCSGLVYPKSEGTAIITATSQDGTDVKGYCTINVGPSIPVECITLSSKSKTINVGETTSLVYNIYPCDATNKSVTWSSSNPNVAEVNAITGSITANKPGTTTITVTTNDGSYVDSCLLTVIIDTVTIQKDGNFNKVVFNKSGKVWRCINYDMIFDENNRNNTFLMRRSNHNFFTYYNENDPFMLNTTPKEYTDDEIKLLYAIDPYGVAHYVQRYAREQFYDNELEGVLGYKDRIFRLLFNKEPRYFAQAYNGEWYVTDDKTDLNNVISESESYFGMHSTYDFLRALVSAIDFATAVLCTIIPNEAADTIVEVGGTLLKVGILYHYEEYQMAFEEVLSLAGDVIFDPQDELIETVFEVFSVFTSFNELINSIATKPRYYCDILDYCINKVNYNVILELENGDKMKIKDIKESIA